MQSIVNTHINIIYTNMHLNIKRHQLEETHDLNFSFQHVEREIQINMCNEYFDYSKPHLSANYYYVYYYASTLNLRALHEIARAIKE